jgi:transposase
MPWRSVSVMEEKEEFILHFKSGKYTVSALAQMFEISRPTAYKFIHRYESAGYPGLLELSRRPRTNPNKPLIASRRRFFACGIVIPDGALPSWPCF